MILTEKDTSIISEGEQCMGVLNLCVDAFAIQIHRMISTFPIYCTTARTHMYLYR